MIAFVRWAGQTAIDGPSADVSRRTFPQSKHATRTAIRTADVREPVSRQAPACFDAEVLGAYKCSISAVEAMTHVGGCQDSGRIEGSDSEAWAG